jgi:protein arginine kinase activator
MLCDNCKKTSAVVHCVEMANGKSVGRHLCYECFKSFNKASSDDTFILSTELFKELLNDLKIIHNEEINKIKCPHCGITWEQIKKTGRFGCAYDYELFKADIAKMLKQHHGSISHIGKFPINNKKMRDATIGRLDQEMKEAVKVENYEKAAELRDKINQLVSSKASPTVSVI